ncbi:MAG: diacylglycerol kinase family protein [Deltaproteobacteria bacterium]|nr:diacylglycerol kinase family protein [Deltaproteobacteria bacterium]
MDHGSLPPLPTPPAESPAESPADETVPVARHRRRAEDWDDVVLRAEHLTDPGLAAIPRPFWRGFIASFEAAIAGVLRTVATQRNMKIHTTAALLVMLVGMALPLDLATRSALIFAIAAVMFAEILNTAIEALVDLFIGTYHRLAMLAKDAAAAGVLLLAVGATVIFCDIIIVNWPLVQLHLDRVWRFALLGVPLAAMQVLILFGPRKGLWPNLATALGTVLLAPLIAWSVDPLFSAAAVLVFLSARAARAFFPGRKPHGAPRR